MQAATPSPPAPSPSHASAVCIQIESAGSSDGRISKETPLEFESQAEPQAAPADQSPPAGASPVPAAESAEDISMSERESRRKKVMEWMESHYPVLTEVFKTTQTADFFHLAEENREDFPHDDAVKVTEEMAGKLLSNDEDDQLTYLKSMFLCVTPESLTPLATLMYQKFQESCPLQIQMVFQYEDAKKVTQLCICLFVRGLLSDDAQQIICDNEVQSTKEDMMNRKVKGAPEELLAASKTAEELERSLYSAYRGWREIPQTDAEHITEAMVKHLEGTYKERKAFLDSLFFSLNYHSLLPLVVTMFWKYREVCPDKLGLLKGWWKRTFLGRVLIRRNELTKEECDKLFKIRIRSRRDQELVDEEKRPFEEHDLCEICDKILKEEPYGYDMLCYNDQVPYDDAVAISKLMLPFLNGDKEKRKSYLKTMNNLSHPMIIWSKIENADIENVIKEYMPDDEDIIGEYNNVAVIMCQQYLDRFPESYSELEEAFSPQYLYLFIVKCLWQRNVLSEVAMSFYVQSILRHQRDELTISHGLIPLLLSLPTTVYVSALVMSEASNFSESIWIQSSQYFCKISFMKFLVAGAMAREEKSCPNDAPYQVLLKAIKNHKSTGMNVELILDVLLLHQAQPQDCDRLDPPNCSSNSEALYLLAAHRGPQFINVAFKLLEFLERNSRPRVIQLIDDKTCDDYTVANIISKMIECKTTAFDDRAKVNFVKWCASYTGCGSRVLTATILWKTYSNLLNFLVVLSDAGNEDVPFAILEEFNIYLYSNQSKAEKCDNVLHVAAKKGYKKFVKLALDRGFAKLLTYSNEKEQLPVQVALECEHYDTAAVMLRAMNDYKLCLQVAEHDSPDSDINSPDSDTDSPTNELVRNRLRENSPRPSVNFRKLLDQLKKGREHLDQQYLSKPKDLQDCVMAILESTIDRDAGVIHHEVLEVDDEGNTPNKKGFECPPMHSIEFVMRNKEYFQVIIDHDSFQYLVNRKWELYGRKIFLIPFFFYLVFLAFLTTAFVLASTKAGSPSKYSQLIDWFRLFCEIVVLLLTIIDILLEINQLYYIVHVIRNTWKVYFTDWTNWLENIAIFLTLLIIPFRIVDLDVQWVFVALAYIFHSLRIFKYAVVKSSFAVYVNTLFQIIKRDIVQFLIVFIVITVSFGGGLYFSLRADTCRLSADRMTTDEVEFSPVTNTSLCLHPNETSEIYLSWLTGLRLLIEGNVIDSYIFGDRGFWWFSVIIYMVFLFLVAVVMLNLLIAQFSKSYEEVTNSARKTVTPDRAKILADQHSTRWIRLCCRIFRFYKRDKNRQSNFMFAPIWYRHSSPYKKSDDETVNDFEKIHNQLSSSKSTDQKQFKELQVQLKEVKADIANSTKDQVTTDYLSTEMNKQAEKIETVRSDMTSQSEVVKELQSEVTALRKQTEIVVKSLGEMKDILQRVLQK